MPSICRFKAFIYAAGYLFGRGLKNATVRLLRGHFLRAVCFSVQCGGVIAGAVPAGGLLPRFSLYGHICARAISARV